jgi:alkaline phosphatase D
MANDPADFTIWMGDHVYFLNPKHWGSHRGMSDRYREVRSKIPYLQTLLDIRPQYAIWDDHEYGPNNANGTWLLKDTSLSVFKTMWANPSYGLPDVPGVFFHVHHADAEFFFTDGRYHCYPWKQMFGPQQMEWLKSALSASDARFKFVVCGSQVISNSATTENLRRYPDEYRELMEFIGEHAIEGVVFLSGDRHFSEISLLERPGKYPLYDLTCSALTSFYFPHGKYNDFQVKGSFTSRSCYGRITLMGSNEDRRCRMEWIDRKGKVLRTWEIRADQLR